MRSAWNAAVRWLRKLGGLVLRIIDSESVRPYQVGIYCMYAFAGLQAIRLGAPTPVVQRVDPGVDAAWAVLLVIAPGLTFVGMWLERRTLAGLCLQLAGDLGVAWSSVTWVLATSEQSTTDRARLAVYVIGALTAAAFAMAVRDLRKIRLVVRRLREMERE